MEINSNVEEINDSAVRILSNWNNSDAIPNLTEIIKTTENETHQILATQGCINLLNESDFPAKKKIRLFRDLFGLTNRIEEKKLILAGLSKIKTMESLRFVSTFLNDEDLKTPQFNPDDISSSSS